MEERLAYALVKVTAAIFGAIARVGKSWKSLSACLIVTSAFDMLSLALSVISSTDVHFLLAGY